MNKEYELMKQWCNEVNAKCGYSFVNRRKCWELIICTNTPSVFVGEKGVFLEKYKELIKTSLGYGEVRIGFVYMKLID